MLPFLGRRWPFLLGLAVGLPALMTPITVLQFEGPGRWILIGATFASGVWLAVLVTVLATGVAGLVMGIQAEERTGSALRLLTRRGWRVVNGLRLRWDADIDHIAVGPAGVLVVETKWSSEPWSPGMPCKPFLAQRLREWAKQARAGRSLVEKHFNRDLGGAPARAVLVIWTPDGSDQGRDWIVHDGVAMVRLSAFSRWLDTLDASVASPEQVRTVWSALERHARSRDAMDEKRFGLPPPTLTLLFRRWVLEPYGGLLAFFYVVAIAGKLRNALVFVVVLAGAAVGGVVARRSRRLRFAATGWLVGWAILVVLVGVASIS